MTFESHPQNLIARQHLADWQKSIQKNCYLIDSDFKHSVSFYLKDKCPHLDEQLTHFADQVIKDLEPLVIENNLSCNLPQLDHEDGIGQQIERIIHHPSYESAGNIIYGSRLLEKMATVGGLLEALTFMFLSSQAGEAGHNCPIACSAGIIRVFQKTADFPNKNFYLSKLIAPSYTENFTGAQFVTEIQGGSDVGINATEAHQDEQGIWRIKGEKWFCSNADAELILVTARYDKNLTSTKGLGLFLIPSYLDSSKRNHYTMRRLKDKIGTRSMASAEMDFHDAIAIPIGQPAEGFRLMMENVLHISRLFNTFCVLGMARRAFNIAYAYAQHRVAFGQPIINYPLVQENLARIKADNTALLASIFATTQLQDDFDISLNQDEKQKLLLRLLSNLNKYLSALWSVEHIHHALDVLAGNGAIETFSTIPRLLRDSIVCENWEGTHNTLRMQVLKDINKYQIDKIFLEHIENALLKHDIPEKYLNTIRQTKLRLQENLKTLKMNSPELQSLQIKNTLDQMAILFCATSLLIEALDQAKKGNPSKRYCLDFFILLHLQEEKIKVDVDYLELISSLISK